VTVGVTVGVEGHIGGGDHRSESALLEQVEEGPLRNAAIEVMMLVEPLGLESDLDAAESGDDPLRMVV